MADPLLWLIYLFIYSNTKRALLGSRKRFGVNGRDVKRASINRCLNLKAMIDLISPADNR